MYNEGGWPNITIPHWDERAEEISRFAKLDMVAFVPLVEIKDRESWEDYANENLFRKNQSSPHHIHPQLHPYPQQTVAPSTDNDLDGSRRIFPCTHFPNETRAGFVEDGQFMERIMYEKGYQSYSLAAPIYQYAPASPVRLSSCIYVRR
jgi:hypothetical protein